MGGIWQAVASHASPRASIARSVSPPRQASPSHAAVTVATVRSVSPTVRRRVANQVAGPNNLASQSADNRANWSSCLASTEVRVLWDAVGSPTQPSPEERVGQQLDKDLTWHVQLRQTSSAVTSSPFAAVRSHV